MGNLADRIARLERMTPPDLTEPPPVSRTWEEWLARRDRPRPPPAPGAKGYFDGPPAAATIEEWMERVTAREAEVRGQ